MISLTDQQLLRDYAENRSEEAFAELTRRHVDFVYSTALRVVRSSHGAEDVTQGVFVALANDARRLADRPVLAGWLHRTTQNLSANVVRSEVRRRTRELEASQMNDSSVDASDADWKQIAPHIDAGLEELGDSDRDAILLRYFQRKSAREIAAALGTTEDAAQKRVARAVERLRAVFAKRGVTIGASGLALILSSNAVQAAPAGLAATVSSSAFAAGTTTSTSTTIHAIAMTTLKKTILIVVGLLICGTAAFVLNRSSTSRTASGETISVNTDKLIGDYEMVGHKISLKKEGNGLAAIIDGKQAFIAYAQSETKFTSHDHNSLSELVFVQDASGRAIGFALIRDGNKLGDLKRVAP